MTGVPDHRSRRIALARLAAQFECMAIEIEDAAAKTRAAMARLDAALHCAALDECDRLTEAETPSDRGG